MGSRLPPPGKAFWVHIPPADGYPGIVMPCPDDCQAATDMAVQHIERWLDDEQAPDLSLALFIGRTLQSRESQRAAYEVAFLWRLQQRLKGNALPAMLTA